MHGLLVCCETMPLLPYYPYYGTRYQYLQLTKLKVDKDRGVYPESSRTYYDRTDASIVFMKPLTELQASPVVRFYISPANKNVRLIAVYCWTISKSC